MFQKLTREGKTFVEAIKKQNLNIMLSKTGFDTILPALYAPAADLLTDEVIESHVLNQGFFLWDTIKGRPVYCYQKGDDSDKVILYLHGGAYIMPPMAEHFSFSAAMARALKATVYFPFYPLAPKADFLQCYDFLDVLYDRILKTEKDKPIIMMGDSAGGGLALAYSESMTDHLFSVVPAARILISPWTDVTMTHPAIPALMQEDIFLSLYGLGIAGQLWAGDRPRTDPRISPHYGKLERNIPTQIFAGEKEILKPDIQRTYGKLKKKGCDVELIIGRGMFHVYPVYDFDMALEARKKMTDFINNHIQ